MVAGERDWRRPWGRRLWGCPLQQSPPCSCCSPHRPQSPRPHLSPPAPRNFGKSRLALQRSQSRRAPLRHQESKSAGMLAGFFWCCAVRWSLPFASHVPTVSTNMCARVALHRARALVPVRAANAQSAARLQAARAAAGCCRHRPRYGWPGAVIACPHASALEPQKCGRGPPWRRGPLSLGTHLLRTWREKKKD